jgi:hypothetical protein
MIPKTAHKEGILHSNAEASRSILDFFFQKNKASFTN